jgi:uncharacterized integral membrane protein
MNNDDSLDRDHRNEHVSTADTARGIGHIIRTLVIIAFVVVLVIVALDNTDDVRIGYAIGDANAPVWIVIVASAIAGIIIGWLIKHRPRRRL